LLSFKLALNNPSKLAELQELEHWKQRFAAASEASEGYFSRRWVAKNILNISEEEFQRMQVESFYDRKHDFALEQVGEAMAAEGGTGGPIEAGFGDEAPDLGAEDTGADEDLETAEPEAADDALLATPGAEEVPDLGEEPPGKRDHKDIFGRPMTTTAKSKGKYYEPAASDRRSAGAKRRSINSDASLYGIGTITNVMPGKKDIDSLYESKTSNYYDEDERQIFRESQEIKKLIQSLEKSTNEV